MKSTDKSTRDLLLEQLSGKNAHIDFERAVQDLTYSQTGLKVEGLPHTIWDLIEHIRRAQDDILEFCKNPDYKEMDWPEDYWPDASVPASRKEFEQSTRAVKEGLEAMRQIIQDPENDVMTPLAHGNGQTLFREALLIVDHNAYHIGQIVQIRRLLGNW